MSPPAWRRGLKPVRQLRAPMDRGSPPAWRRGLKLPETDDEEGTDTVASRVEARIETNLEHERGRLIAGRLPRGGAD